MAFLLRVRESVATLASIGLVALVVTTFSLGSAIYLAEQGTRGVQAGVGERSRVDLALRASLALATNGERQDAEVRAAIADTFAGTGVAVEVTRAMASHVTVHPISEDRETEDRGGAAWSIHDFDGMVVIVDGSAPSGATEVAVQADAAKALALAPGQQVLLAGVRFTIAGTWRPRDALDPRWYGEDMVASGFHDDFGPFIINEAAWGRLDLNPEVSWTIVPDAAAIDSRNSAMIIDSWGAIRDDWRGSVSSIQTLSGQNRLVQTLKELEARLDGLRAVQPVVFTLLAAVGLVVMAELVRLLAVTRRRQAELYWSRGASTGAIAARSARDVGAAGAIGTIAGLGVVAALVLATGRGLADLGHGIQGVVAPVIVLVGAVVLAVVRNRQVGTVDLRRSVRQRRRRGVAIPGAVVLALLAASVSVWQLRLYGSPMTPTVDGVGGVDPIAVIAPAAALVAAVLLLLAAFPWLASQFERRARRLSLNWQLAARGLVRRLAVVSAPLIVVALAVGSAATAASFSATWDVAFAETAALRVGSDLHASAGGGGIAPDAQDEVAKLDAVDAVAPIDFQPLSVGGQSGSILGATPEALVAVAGVVAGKFDPVAAADAIRLNIPGPTIPQGTSNLSMSVDAEGFVDAPTTSIWVSNAAGFVRGVSLSTVESEIPQDGDQVFTYNTGEWPVETDGPWRVIGIDFDFAEQSFKAAPAKLHVRELVAVAGGVSSTLDLNQFWIANNAGVQGPEPTTDAADPGFFLFDDLARARLTPSLNRTLDDRPVIPIVISQQLADRFSVELGDSLSFNLRDGVDRLNCTVAGIVAAVPGAPLESAVLMDLGVIQHFQLRTRVAPSDPHDLWITTTNPEGAMADLRAALPSDTRIESKQDESGRRVLGSATVVFWAAAGAASLLALIGVASSARARLRSGRNDFGVLRALGLRERDQASIVSREFAIVIAIGLLGGLAAGALVAVLTIPYFARAAVTAPYLAIDTVLVVDVVGLAALVVSLLIATTIILAALRQIVRTVARRSLPSEASE